jgi:tetratricopeptide (TPR) repeat protein
LVFAVLLTWGFQIGDKIQEVAGPGAAYDLARQYQRRGSYFKAANTFHDAEMMYRKRLGPDNAWVIRCITGRADCLVKLERFDDAVKMLLQAIPLVEPRGDAAWLESLQTKMRYAQERATPDA